MLLDLTRSEMTLLAVTYEIAFAREVADRLVFMNAGEIVEVVTPDTFLDNTETDRTKLVSETASLTCPCPDCTSRSRGLPPSQSRDFASGMGRPTAHPPKPRPAGLSDP